MDKGILERDKDEIKAKKQIQAGHFSEGYIQPGSMRIAVSCHASRDPSESPQKANADVSKKAAKADSEVKPVPIMQKPLSKPTKAQVSVLMSARVSEGKPHRQ